MFSKVSNHSEGQWNGRAEKSARQCGHASGSEGTTAGTGNRRCGSTGGRAGNVAGKPREHVCAFYMIFWNPPPKVRRPRWMEHRTCGECFILSCDDRGCVRRENREFRISDSLFQPNRFVNRKQASRPWDAESNDRPKRLLPSPAYQPPEAPPPPDEPPPPPENPPPPPENPPPPPEEKPPNPELRREPLRYREVR